MKKLFLLFLLLSFSLQAQIQKLSELSKNRFLDSKIIYDDNGEDVWGYLFLYQNDNVSKSVLELEFVILDKNLNKVGANTFQQEYLNTFLFKAYPSIDYLKKTNEELMFALDFENPDNEGSLESEENDSYGLYFFRKINLKDFSIGSGYFLRNEKIIENENIIETFDNKHLLPDHFLPISNVGFIKYEREFKGKNEFSTIAQFQKADVKGYSFYDLNLNKKWEIKYNNTKESGVYHRRKTANNKYLIVGKSFYGKSYKKKSSYFYEVKDINTGQEIFSIPTDDSRYIYVNDKIFIQDNKIYIFDRIYEFKDKFTYQKNKCLGISKQVYDVDTKSLVEQKFMYWTDLTKFCKISKYGELNGDFIHFLDYKTTSDGNTAIVGEGYDPGQHTKIKNFYTLILDNEFKVKSFNEIVKQKNTFQDYIAYGKELENNNLFDFMYSQKIKKDEFVYFYSDNEVKRGFINTIIPDLGEVLPDNWVLGIVAYYDGEFKNQKINLKTKKGKIYPMKAKKGYIILKEVTKNDVEIRLEKIDY